MHLEMSSANVSDFLLESIGEERCHKKSSEITHTRFDFYGQVKINVLSTLDLLQASQTLQ